MYRYSQSSQKDILKALAYYDVFNFPLNFEELFLYSNFTNKSAFLDTLNSLLSDQIIFKVGHFYALRSDEYLSTERVKNDNRALDYHTQARIKSRLIAKFPYVKGVFISGSLSKGTMAEDGDIDYFIITEPNRLWIARTLLILYKKVFLLNSRKYFCINYLIDSETLEIENKNRFTATELATLLPMNDAELYADLLKSNPWIYDYLPNELEKSLPVEKVDRSLFKKLVEPVLNSKIGDVLDDFFMALTLRRWKKKFGNMSTEDFEIALRTSKKISKHHPSHFQKKVLAGFDERMARMEVKLANPTPKSELLSA